MIKVLILQSWCNNNAIFFYNIHFIRLIKKKKYYNDITDIKDINK